MTSTLARPTTRRTPMTTGLIGALNLEWRRLADTPLPRNWAPAQLFVDATTVGELIDRVSQMRASASTDATLHALLTLHAAGDQLAGRTVLQTMLGKAARLARTAHARGIEDANVAAVEAVWTAIHRYPLTRTSSVAGNIALDALAGLLRQAATPVSSTDLEQLAAETADPEEFQHNLTRVLGWALDHEVITADDVRLLARLHLSDGDVTLRQAAAEGRVSYAAMRQRHSRLVRKLAAAVSSSLEP